MDDIEIISGTSESVSVEDFQKINGLKIVHFNVGKLTDFKHKDIIQNLVNENLDVLTCTESWMKNSQCEGTYGIPGYNMFRQDRN